MSQSKRFPSGLYGVTPDWDDAQRLEQAVAAAIAGGMTALQLRHKTASPAQRLSLAKRLQPICGLHHVPLIINDDWQLAQAVGADGVHLGKDDEDPAKVRDKLGPDMLLGVSCYSDLDRARRMLTLGVDYVAFGAMFASGTKPHAPGASLDIIKQAHTLTATMASDAAVVAIGGITVDNAPSILDAGADSLAVIGGLFMASDIETTARAFQTLMRSSAAK